MRQINLRLADECVQRIDGMRGKIPRERYIRAIINRHVDFYADDSTFDCRTFVEEVEAGDPVLRGVVDGIDQHRDGRSRLSFIFDKIKLP